MNLLGYCLRWQSYCCPVPITAFSVPVLLALATYCPVTANVQTERLFDLLFHTALLLMKKEGVGYRNHQKDLR